MNKSEKNRSFALMITLITIVLVISLLAPSLSAISGKNKYSGVGYGYGGEDCTRTQGYWKNHPDDWPVEEITIGGIIYTKEDAINILNTPVQGDMTIAMFYQLVVAKLNVENGVPSGCIDDTIVDADDWMSDYPLSSNVEASSYAWEIGEPLHDLLDDYNNGLLCAPHCD